MNNNQYSVRRVDQEKTLSVIKKNQQKLRINLIKNKRIKPK